MANKTVEEYKRELETNASDTVIILMRKYNLPQQALSALIEAYQQGAAKSMEIAKALHGEFEKEVTTNIEQLPF